MPIKNPHRANRELSVLAGGLVIYYFAVIGMCLFAIDRIGPRVGAIFLVALLCSIPVMLALKSRAFDPLEPVWLYSAIFFLEFALKPLLTLWNPARFGFTMLPLDYENMHVSRSLVVAGAGLLAFYVGYYFVLRVRGLPVFHLSDKWLPGRELILFSSGLISFLYAVHFFFSRAGYSFSMIYLNRAAIGGLSGELAFLVQIFGWIAALIPFRHCLEKKDRVAWVVFALFLLVILAGFSIFGSRWTLFFIPVSLLIISHYVVSRLSVVRILGAFCGLFIITATFGAFRGNFEVARLTPGAIVENVGDEISAFADWDIFLAIQEFYPEYRPHYYGRLAAESFLWLIPRSIWSGKPVQYGPGRIQDDIAPGLRTINLSGGYSGTAISQSTIGEGYADFGLIGGLLYMALFGVAWGWVYRIARDNAFSFPMTAIYSLMYLLLPLCVRGFSSPLIMLGLWGLLATTAFAFLSGRRRTIH